MDYRRFLAKTESCVLPFVGGTRVSHPTRSLRVSEPPVLPGYYRFDVAGRVATCAGAADPPDLSDRPKVRGHFVAGLAVTGGTGGEEIAFVPAEEPPVLSPVVARRWHGGELLWDSIDFETDAEGACRTALEEDRAIGDQKGVPPGLRAAYAYALVLKRGRRLDVEASLLEVMPAVLDVSARGVPAADELLRRLRDERERFARETRERHAEIAREAARERRRQAIGEARATIEDRIEKALTSAHATLRATRDLGNGSYEVTYLFENQRFISTVDVVTLNVIDSGVCLAGSDRLVTLDSLPGVIREAIRTSRLVITRR